MGARRLKDPTLTSPRRADAITGRDLTSHARLHPSRGTHPQASRRVRAGRKNARRGREGRWRGGGRGLRGRDSGWQHPLGAAPKLVCLLTAGERAQAEGWGHACAGCWVRATEPGSALSSTTGVSVTPSLFGGASTC